MQAEQVSTALASLANYSLEEAIPKVGELGFLSIGFLCVGGARHSIGDLPGFWFDELSHEKKLWLREAVRPYRRVGMHAPFVDAPLVSYSRHVMETSLRLIKTGMEAAAFLGADVAAVHVNSRSFFEVGEYWQPLMQVLRELGDYGALLGVRVAVETGFPRDLEAYLRIVEEADHPMVGATLDVGHVAFSVERDLWGTDAGVRQHNDYIIRVIERLGPKIVHTHIHDVRKADWRDHREVGTGIIEWGEVFACLKAHNYPGLLELELEEQDREGALIRSRERMEALL